MKALLLSPEHEQLMNDVLRAFFVVYNELGYGLYEHMYMTALEMVLVDWGFRVAREVVIPIPFRDRMIGRIRADMLVNDLLFVEAKTGPVLPRGCKEQLFRYVERAHKPLGLLLYFGPSPQFKRVILGS